MFKPSLLFCAAVWFLAAGRAEASGFRCTDGANYDVRLYNHVEPHLGTRNPALFILGTAEGERLLIRRDEEIRKSNRMNVVRYAVDGDAELGVDTVILQIPFLEGKQVLEAGEIVLSHLILVGGSERFVMPVSCERYLKGRP